MIFGVRYTTTRPKSLIFKLHQKSVTPDSLLKDIRNAVGKPYLELCGPESEAIKAEKWNDLEQGLQNIVKLWETDREEVTQILLEDKGLNRSKFKLAVVEQACSDMADITSLYDIDADLIKRFEKFKRSYIETGTKEKLHATRTKFLQRLGILLKPLGTTQ